MQQVIGIVKQWLCIGPNRWRALFDYDGLLPVEFVGFKLGGMYLLMRVSGILHHHLCKITGTQSLITITWTCVDASDTPTACATLVTDAPGQQHTTAHSEPAY